jgi:hypothetical protein
MFVRLSRPTNPSDDGRLNAPQELTGHLPTKATSWNTIALSHSLTISELHYLFALLLSSFSGSMTQNGRGATEWGKAKNGMEPSFINGVGLEYRLNVLHGQL